MMYDTVVSVSANTVCSMNAKSSEETLVAITVPFLLMNCVVSAEVYDLNMTYALVKEK